MEHHHLKFVDIRTGLMNVREWRESDHADAQVSVNEPKGTVHMRKHMLGDRRFDCTVRREKEEPPTLGKSSTAMDDGRREDSKHCKLKTPNVRILDHRFRVTCKNRDLRPQLTRELLPEHGFGKEPKLEKGFGHIPDTIEVKLTWRTVAGTWLGTHLGEHRSLRPNCRNSRTPGAVKPESQIDVRNQ